MGWLFAVALAIQDKSQKAIARALAPIALGHGLAIGIIVLLAGLAGAVLPLRHFRIAAAVLLFAFGLLRLVRNRHPRWVGMQVGFKDLVIWSFMMASAHGAGFMLLPILLVMPGAGMAAVVIHTGGYLIVTGLVAWLVYAKLGLAFLRRGWLNLDLVWAVALMATGVFTLLI